MEASGTLEERLTAVAESSPGRLGVAARDDRGWSWSFDAERVSRSASTIKVPILVTVLRLVEQGRLDLGDHVAIAAFEDRVGGCGPLSLLPSVTSLAGPAPAPASVAGSSPAARASAAARIWASTVSTA